MIVSFSNSHMQAIVHGSYDLPTIWGFLHTVSKNCYGELDQIL